MMIRVYLLIWAVSVFSFSSQAEHRALEGFQLRGQSKPVAVLPEGGEVSVGDTVTVSGMNSSGMSGNVTDLVFRWSFDIIPEDSNSKINDPTATQISFVPDAIGLYVIKLVVGDSVGNSAPAYMAVRVKEVNQLPTVGNFYHRPEPYSRGLPILVYFYVDAPRSDPDGKIAGYEFDFGNGKIVYVNADDIDIDSRREIEITHLYTSAGNYTATLAVIDDRGGRTTKTMEVSISDNRALVPSFSVNVRPDAKNPGHYLVQLDATSASDPDGTIEDYHWTIYGPADGLDWYKGVTASFSVSPDKVGNYSIEFHGTDDDGRKSATYADVYVGPNTSSGSSPSPVVEIGPISGRPPLTITADASNSFDVDGGDFEVLWSFDDADINIAPVMKGKKVTHTLFAPGRYDGYLLIRDPQGNSTNYYFNVYVRGSESTEIAPQIIALEREGGVREFHFTFIREHGLLKNTSHSNVYLDFGDGNKSIGSYIDHQYEREGNYLVKRTIVDIDGSLEVLTKLLTVRNDGAFPNMDVRITRGGELIVNRPVVFDHSYSQSTSGAPLAFSYAFSGGEPLLPNVLGDSIPHTFERTGFYQVLAFAEEEGRNSMSYNDLTIVGGVGTPPTPSFSVSKRIGVAPLTVAFDASSSKDDGRIVSYNWKASDYSVEFVDMFSSGISSGHTYLQAGEYSPRLGLVDDSGDISIHHGHIIVLNEANPDNQMPQAIFAASVDGPTVSFNSRSSSDADGDIRFYDWTFGDGSIDEVSDPRHTYERAGPYQVTLRVTDNDGGVDTSTQTVVVNLGLGKTGLLSSKSHQEDNAHIYENIHQKEMMFLEREHF